LMLPRERSKNRRPHNVALSSQAWRIIEAMPHIAGCDFVFTADGKKPVTGWDKAKVRISAKAGIASESWRLHDLRRSCASGMQRLGVSVPVIEKALNHISGTFRGIVGTYQQHDYADEVGIALQKWGTVRPGRLNAPDRPDLEHHEWSKWSSRLTATLSVRGINRTAPDICDRQQ
jgi:integrase